MTRKSFQNVAQADVKRSQLASIISRCDRNNAPVGLGSRAQSGGGGPLDGFQAEAVDDDLVAALDFGRQVGGNKSAHRRREPGVGTGAKRLVLAADLRTRAGDSTRKRQD